MSRQHRQSFTRRGFLTAMAATGVAAGAFALLDQRAMAAPQKDHSKGAATMVGQMSFANAAPTIVLVHGAFADSSSFNGVIARLQAQGYPVVAAANPLRGLKADSEYVASVLKSIPGPIVLVGHSYGGSVISNVATGNSNVVGLVYVAAFAPEEGETANDLQGRFPGNTLGQALAAPVGLPGGGAEVSIQQDKFWQQFAADLPEADAKLAAATQRPVALDAFTDPAGAPAWKTIPSRFIYGDQDQAILATLHAFMAERAGSQKTVAIPGASHVVMISHPDEIAEMIHQSALAFATTRSAA